MGFSLGAFGDLVSAVSDLLASSGIELVVNFGLIVVLAAIGFAVGRAVVARSLLFAAVMAAVGGAMFGYGAPAGYFVMNLGVFYLAFLYPVWEEAYLRANC